MIDATPSRPAADRNLLFGILALQMDFINRDALIQAMHAWVLDKHKPLGQVLSEQGALSADERIALDTLVAQHLRRHGGDPEQSLAAVPLAPAVRQALQAVADPDLQASVHSLAPTPAWALEKTGPYQPPAADGSRYRVLRPHAKGGLGEVFVAEDTELHRDVALKEIQAERAHDPHSRSRFLLEAEVNGRLEHPHIVPVYGLGTYPDGRPYYAMRFIQGDTLKEAIRRFHAPDGPGRDAGERSLALRQLLGRFVAICNAVAYAHSRGVVHRDLKPANVLLGPFGETLLVDWGLAKVVGRAESAMGSGDVTLRPTACSELATRAGTALGTPAYMSPEQAQGRLDQIGPASDIYGLGATLYAVLTGHPPVESRDEGEVLRRVSQGDWPLPSQMAKGVPRALEAVCLKAMALRPEDRYPSVLDLARDLEHWLADEPVSAWREPLRLRAGRWVRRHQTGVAAAAAAVLVAVLLGGSGAVWVERQRAERQAEQARQEQQWRQGVEAALTEVARLQAQNRWVEAKVVLQQVDNQLGDNGPEDLRGLVDQARRNLALVERLEAIHLARAARVEGKFDDVGADRDYAHAFAEAGVGQAGDDVQAVADRLGASAVRGRLLAALDDWAYCVQEDAQRDWILAVARRVDPHPWRDRARDPALWRDRAALARLAAEVEAEEQPPQLVAAVARQMGEERVGLLRRAQARHPNDFWLNFYLANALMGLGSAGGKRDAEEAVEYYRAALALRPDTSSVYNNLGSALNSLGRREESLAACQEAIRLDPKHGFAHNNLGFVLRALGRQKEALAEFQEAVRLDPWNAKAHSNLGDLLCNLGRHGEALPQLQEAIRLDPQRAYAHQSLGIVLLRLGRREEAVTAFQEAIRLEPKDALVHYNLGNALRALRRREEAVAAYQEAIRLDPKNASAHYNLGGVLRDLGRRGEAAVAFQQVIGLDPGDARAHNNLGRVLLELGLREQAVTAYQEATRLEPKNAARHSDLGQVLYQLQRWQEALAACQEAIRLDPTNAGFHSNLGLTLWKLKRLPEALAEYQEAIRLNPKLAVAHSNRATVLRDLGRQEEAVSAYQEAIRLNPKYALAHYNLGIALNGVGRAEEALDAYREAIRLDPNHAEAHCNLGLVLQQQGRFADALAALQRGHELGSKKPGWSYPSARWIQETEWFLALDGKLSAVLKGETAPANAAEQAQLGHMCVLNYRQLYRTSVRFYADAFAADPHLAEDVEQGHRYNAACAAVLAGRGQGRDAEKPTEEERVRLRQQALAWLKADLARWSERSHSEKPPEKAQSQRVLRRWQQDTDLAGVRGDALAKLPDSEASAWTALWAEVDALLKQLERKK